MYTHTSRLAAAAATTTIITITKEDKRKKKMRTQTAVPKRMEQSEIKYTQIETAIQQNYCMRKHVFSSVALSINKYQYNNITY